MLLGESVRREEEEKKRTKKNKKKKHIKTMEAAGKG